MGSLRVKDPTLVAKSATRMGHPPACGDVRFCCGLLIEPSRGGNGSDERRSLESGQSLGGGLERS